MRAKSIPPLRRWRCPCRPAHPAPPPGAGCPPRSSASSRCPQRTRRHHRTRRAVRKPPPSPVPSSVLPSRTSAGRPGSPRRLVRAAQSRPSPPDLSAAGEDAAGSAGAVEPAQAAASPRKLLLRHLLLAEAARNPEGAADGAQPASGDAAAAAEDSSAAAAADALLLTAMSSAAAAVQPAADADVAAAADAASSSDSASPTGADPSASPPTAGSAAASPRAAERGGVRTILSHHLLRGADIAAGSAKAAVEAADAVASLAGEALEASAKAAAAAAALAACGMHHSAASMHVWAVACRQHAREGAHAAAAAALPPIASAAKAVVRFLKGALLLPAPYSSSVRGAATALQLCRWHPHAFLPAPPLSPRCRSVDPEGSTRSGDRRTEPDRADERSGPSPSRATPPALSRLPAEPPHSQRATAGCPSVRVSVRSQARCSSSWRTTFASARGSTSTSGACGWRRWPTTSGGRLRSAASCTPGEEGRLSLRCRRACTSAPSSSHPTSFQMRRRRRF